MKRVLIIVLSLYSLVLSAEELTEKEKLVNLSEMFIECTGLKSATAKHMKKLGGSDEEIAFLNGAANGSRIAAMLILSDAHSDGKKAPLEYEAYIDSISSSYEAKFAALWAMPETDTESRAMIKQSMQMCTQLSPLQAKLMNDLRKQALLPK